MINEKPTIAINDPITKDEFTRIFEPGTVVQISASVRKQTGAASKQFRYNLDLGQCSIQGIIKWAAEQMKTNYNNKETRPNIDKLTPGDIDIPCSVKFDMNPLPTVESIEESFLKMTDEEFALIVAKRNKK